MAEALSISGQWIPTGDASAINSACWGTLSAHRLPTDVIPRLNESPHHSSNHATARGLSTTTHFNIPRILLTEPPSLRANTITPQVDNKPCSNAPLTMAKEPDPTKRKSKIPLPARTYGFPPEAFDWSHLPDVDTNFLPPEHLEAFIQALSAPDPVQSPGADTSLNSPTLPRQQSNASSFFDFGSRSSQSREATPVAPEYGDNTAQAGDVLAPRSPNRTNSESLFISAHTDWAPVHEKVLGSKNRRRSKLRVTGSENSGKGKKKRVPRVPLEVLVGSRSKDETREGYLYSLLKWPFLLIVGAWILGLSVAYLVTRFYIFCYEQGVAWRGKREKLRRAMRATGNYREWVVAAKAMDEFFGNGKWKEENEFAYYDSKTVRRVGEQMRKARMKAERVEVSGEGDRKAVEDLKALIEACVKNNFVGVENPRLYSQTYYGTKNLVQGFVDEGSFSTGVDMRTWLTGFQWRKVSSS